MSDVLKRRSRLPQAGTSGRAGGIEGLQQLNFLHLFYFWNVAREGSIARACKRLHVTQPTISAQIRRLEHALGHELFARTGRSLVLTDAGTTVFEYAEDIFSVGREMLAVLRGVPSQRTTRLMVGVPKVMPKLITYRLLEPVLHLPQHVQIVCRESEPELLLRDLSRHRFDVILSDTVLQPDERVRMYHHHLGSSRIAICGKAALAEIYRRGFPESLARAPFLLPSPGNEMRRALDRWFESHACKPPVIGEFDDSALLKEFGHAGAGLFPVPAAVLPEVIEQYSVEQVGLVPEVRLNFYAISTERKLTHPAVKAISQKAKEALLADESSD